MFNDLKKSSGSRTPPHGWKSGWMLDEIDLL